MEARTCSGDYGALTVLLHLERICHLRRAGYRGRPSLGSDRLVQLHRPGRIHRLCILLRRMELRGPVEPPLLLVALPPKLLSLLLLELELKLLVLPLEQLEPQKLLLQLVDAMRDS